MRAARLALAWAFWVFLAWGFCRALIALGMLP